MRSIGWREEELIIDSQGLEITVLIYLHAFLCCPVCVLVGGALCIWHWYKSKDWSLFLQHEPLSYKAVNGKQDVLIRWGYLHHMSKNQESVTALMMRPVDQLVCSCKTTQFYWPCVLSATWMWCRIMNQMYAKLYK